MTTIGSIELNYQKDHVWTKIPVYEPEEIAAPSPYPNTKGLNHSRFYRFKNKKGQYLKIQEKQ